MKTVICSKCVLDTNTPYTNLKLDEYGICNNCRTYDQYSALQSKESDLSELTQIITSIKKEGKDRQYDCILGISGGIDSSYLALLAKKNGLRPLVVHFDNGWNSELAVSNIHNITKSLGFDLHTYVINWEEFRDLQLSYIKASVIDIEIPTDQFIVGTLYELAYKHKIKYILNGVNTSTEFSNLSLKWGYKKTDLVNLKNIHKKFGKTKLSDFPKIGFMHYFFYSEIYGLKSVSLLNYVPYIKDEVTEIISKELGWKNPGGKHFESIFTRFYQGYILPNKFGIDKRRLHLSNLIWSGQISREEALSELSLPIYPIRLQETDKQYVIKKLELTLQEFENIMKMPMVLHEFYGVETETIQYIIFQKIIKIPLLVKAFRFLMKISL